MLESASTASSPLDPDETYEGYIEINQPTEVVDAAFSSDGNAIAVASADGFVKFFQVSNSNIYLFKYG